MSTSSQWLFQTDLQRVFMCTPVCAAAAAVCLSHAGHPDPHDPTLAQQGRLICRRAAQLSLDIQMQHPGLIWSDTSLVLIGEGTVEVSRQSPDGVCTRVCVCTCVCTSGGLDHLEEFQLPAESAISFIPRFFCRLLQIWGKMKEDVCE